MEKSSKFENYDNFVNKIFHGDARDILKNIPDCCIHLVFTSPPYNAGHNYVDYSDNLKWDDYKNFMFEVISELKRVLISGGRLVINVPFAVKNKITKEVHFLATEISHICNKVGFVDFEFILWHKGSNQNHFQGNNTAWGSWCSPSNPVCRPLGEAILVFSKDGKPLKGSKENIDITAEEFKEWTKNVWYIPNANDKSKHPCPFPEELAKRVIKLYSYRGNIVLDPFNGTGTTTKVAYELGRKFIGIDISSKYCEIAINKLKQLCLINSTI